MRKENIKKFRINIMDIIVILLALACIVSIVLRGVSIEDSYKPKEYRLYFQIDEIRSSSYSFFDGHEGDTVRIKESGEFLGTLGAEFTCGAPVQAYNDTEGDASSENPNTDYSEKCSINGYIIITGEVTTEGIMINGATILKENQVIEIVTEYIEATIRITAMEENRS